MAITYASSNSSLVTSTTLTISSVNIPSASNRLIVAAFISRQGAITHTIVHSSITVGGVSMSKLGEYTYNNFESNSNKVSLWALYGNSPTGLSNIVFSASPSAKLYGGISIFSGVKANSSVTPVWAAGSTGNISVSLTPPKAGSLLWGGFTSMSDTSARTSIAGGTLLWNQVGGDSSTGAVYRMSLLDNTSYAIGFNSSTADRNIMGGTYFLAADDGQILQIKIFQ